MPRAAQKLVKNGNATSVTIPRTMLVALGWLTGQAVIVEQLENNAVLIRLPNERDFGPVGPPRMIYDTPAPVTR